MKGRAGCASADRIGELLASVQLPLENIEFVIEQYLLVNAAWLDPETRSLLAGVRDGVGRVAASSRTLARGSSAEAPDVAERVTEAA